MKRIKDLESAASGIQEVDVGDGWVEATGGEEDAPQQAVVDMDMEAGAKMQVVGGVEAEAPAQEQEIADMDALMEDDNDENCFEQFVSKEGDDSDDEMGGAFASSQGARKYDLSITYDFFHQTPRMWLLGYSSEGALLSQQEMFEDIMADYAQKTVTYEEHPKLTQKQLSIHPCNHANAMKRIISVIVENGGKPRVEFSLFVFLKFISSVTPTIEYDFTVDLELD